MATPLTRKSFLTLAGVAAIGAATGLSACAAGGTGGTGAAPEAPEAEQGSGAPADASPTPTEGAAMDPIVYFTRSTDPSALVDLYEQVGITLAGPVAVKLHSGEAGNQNFLSPDFVAPIVGHVGGTVVECNTAYGGARDTTDKHRRLMDDHGWSAAFPVDIMDAEQPDLVLPVENPLQIGENHVGAHLANYQSMLVLSHFKGHAMGGFGGALKQLSIGIASSHGKALIHGAGNASAMWSTEQDLFLESMVDAAGSVIERFAGNIVYLTAMVNISRDCDCDANAEAPCMADIGMLASADPVAIDQACLDIVYASDDPGRDRLVERIESRHGTHTVDMAASQGLGSKTYRLVEID